MTSFSEDRLTELRALFFESAQELLQALNEEGLELEKRPGDSEVVRSVRRTVHTLKGDSAAVGYRELSELAHQLEDVLTPEFASSAGAGLAEIVLTAADVFEGMLAAYRGNLQLPSSEGLHRMIAKLTQQPAAAGAVAAPGGPSAAFAWSEYERLVITGALDQGRQVYNIAMRLDPACPMKDAALELSRRALTEAGCLLAMRPEKCAPETEVIEAAVSSQQTAEWIAAKCRVPSVVTEVTVAPFPIEAALLNEPVSERDPLGILGARNFSRESSSVPMDGVAARDGSGSLKETTAEPDTRAATPASTDSVLRIGADRIDIVLNLVGELIIGKSMLHQAFHEFSTRFPKDPLRTRFADAMAFQSRVLAELHRSVMKIRMVPVEQLFRRFPRLVRDVSKQRGKQATLVVTGERTELDKSILDSLAEPLSHLVRNAVDHGVESPEERVASGKPAEGTVRLHACHHGNQVIIEVEDDGRGINRQKVVQCAVERGIIGSDEADRLSEHEALKLIFESGMSTAAEVTSISGRGVGMDVVRAVLERLKGTISIETTPGAGTKFLLKVPLTMAIIKALLFRVNQRLYAVPLSSVLEITRATGHDVHQVDKHEVIQLRDEVLTLVRMGQLTDGQSGTASGPRLFVVVIGMADRKFGLVVDKLVGEEELVIKALDDRLVATELVSGASILGDGSVVLILNMSAVVEHLARTWPKAAATAGGTA